MLDLPAGEFSQFNNNQRTYASMKQWILQKIDGKLKPLPGQSPID